jgi:hypothetical protein
MRVGALITPAVQQLFIADDPGQRASVLDFGGPPPLLQGASNTHTISPSPPTSALHNLLAATLHFLGDACRVTVECNSIRDKRRRLWPRRQNQGPKCPQTPEAGTGTGQLEAGFRLTQVKGSQPESKQIKVKQATNSMKTPLLAPVDGAPPPSLFFGRKEGFFNLSLLASAATG